VKIRAEVAVFAERMEQRLVANEHKGGWEDNTVWELLGRVREELQELECALHDYSGHRRAGSVDEVRSEAADVANFLMMITDVLSP
jgi:NTP pyrophosphatase (non-canonical NTP hydrolase)